MSKRTLNEEVYDWFKKLPHKDSYLNKLREKNKEGVKEWLSTLTSEQRSDWSKNGWAKEEGYEERREHIRAQAEKNKEENSKRFKEYNQDSERQSSRGKKGGPKGGKAVWETHYKDELKCPHCPTTGKGPVMDKYHFDKCKKNPNRVVEYKYELVMDGKSYGKFEEKQSIAEYLECSAALISKYMSGKKKDIKGYQIVTI